MIRDRPREICGDFVSMNTVIANDLESINADMYVQTHTTNPLLQANSLELAIGKQEVRTQEGYDSLFSVTRFQDRLYDEHANPQNRPANLVRTQDLPPYSLRTQIFICLLTNLLRRPVLE